MKIRVEQTTSPAVKTKTKIKLVWVFMGGVIIAGIIVFLCIFLFNMLGSRQQAAAEKIRRYTFDIASAELRTVNFTVLEPTINSVFAEVRPLISANGQKLFFCRRNHPKNTGQTKDNQDVWVSSLVNGQWNEPENAGPIINTTGVDAVCSVSPDGSEIIFLHENLSQEKQLMRTTRSNKGWSLPEAISIENYYNLQPYVDFFYSYETGVLLMGITRRDSKGEQDLYVSFPTGKNQWTEPLSLGPVVNSKLSDFAPFLASDGRTLYFASYGHNGFGGCDIYQTTRLDNTWQAWSEPRNLGKGINSDREESYFSISGNNQHIYFESYDIKNQVRDIFRADIPESFKPGPIPSQENIIHAAGK